MANVDAPRGMKWVGNINGDSKPVIREHIVKDGVTIYKGALVEWDGADEGRVDAANSATAVTDGKVVGVAAGTATGTTDDVLITVIQPHGAIFEIQCDDTLITNLLIDTAVAHLTDAYAMLTGITAVTGLDQSNMELDGSSANNTNYGTTNILKIYGFPKRPDNVAGVNVKLHVTLTPECCIPGFTPSLPHARA